MHKTLRITVDGRSHDVVVEEADPASPQAAPGVVATPTVVAAPTPPPAPPPAAASARPSAPAPAGAGVIVAPLGGMVVSLDVSVGQVIAVGDKVAVLEVMKMQTDVRSKVAGRSSASPPR